MAKAKPYSEEQRQRAIEIYVEHGRKAAQDETGINGKTISSWVTHAGLAAAVDIKRQKAIDAARNSLDLTRERIKEKLAFRTEWALDMMDQEFVEIVVDQRGGVHEIRQKPKPADVKNYMITAGTGFDKLQLATGGSTSNQTVQNPSLTALVQQQQQKNEAVQAELVAAAAEGVSE